MSPSQRILQSLYTLCFKSYQTHKTSAAEPCRCPLQGWSRERVVGDAVPHGRILMVLPTDAAQHVKKIQEVCMFVEQLHGMAQGWLLGCQDWKVGALLNPTLLQRTLLRRRRPVVAADGCWHLIKHLCCIYSVAAGWRLSSCRESCHKRYPWLNQQAGAAGVMLVAPTAAGAHILHKIALVHYSKTAHPIQSIVRCCRCCC